MRLMSITTAVLFAISGVAVAQSPNPPSAPSPPSPSAQSGNKGEQLGQGAGTQPSGAPADVEQKVKQRLEQDGYSDIQVMGQALVVRAKDKNGQPVTMAVNPNLITAPSSETTGSGASGNGAEKNASPGADAGGSSPSGK